MNECMYVQGWQVKTSQTFFPLHEGKTGKNHVFPPFEGEKPWKRGKAYFYYFSNSLITPFDPGLLSILHLNILVASEDERKHPSVVASGSNNHSDPDTDTDPT